MATKYNKTSSRARNAQAQKNFRAAESGSQSEKFWEKKLLSPPKFRAPKRAKIKTL